MAMNSTKCSLKLCVCFVFITLSVHLSLRTNLHSMYIQLPAALKHSSTDIQNEQLEATQATGNDNETFRTFEDNSTAVLETQHAVVKPIYQTKSPREQNSNTFNTQERTSKLANISSGVKEPVMNSISKDHTQQIRIRLSMNSGFTVETGRYPANIKIGMNNSGYYLGDYPLFQSTVEEEFPTVTGGNPRIPHLIHQIFHSDTIPLKYAKNINSFVVNNPSWEYRFWTFESGRKLLKDRHPYLLETYDSFGTNDVKKADVLRIAILHEFGGVYADLDVTNLRSLDIATVKYACIIPVEPFELPAIYAKWPFVLTTSVMLCRPKHHFFKSVLKNLVGSTSNGYAPIATGLMFLTKQYLLYNNLTWSDVNKTKTDFSSNSPYFYKGKRNETDEDGIYIPNCQYFTDTVDKAILSGNGNPNDCGHFEKLSYLSKRACVESERRKMIRRNHKYLFTVHDWHKLWLQSNIYFSEMRYIHIKHVVPDYTMYDS